MYSTVLIYYWLTFALLTSISVFLYSYSCPDRLYGTSKQRCVCSTKGRPKSVNTLSIASTADLSARFSSWHKAIRCIRSVRTLRFIYRTLLLLYYTSYSLLVLYYVYCSSDSATFENLNDLCHSGHLYITSSSCNWPLGTLSRTLVPFEVLRATVLPV